MTRRRRNRYAAKHAIVRCFRCRRDFAMRHEPTCPVATKMGCLDTHCIADVKDPRYEDARRAAT